MKKACFLFILPVLTVLCISSHISATTRGISVVSKHGQSLYLYKDYHALVVGVGDYDYWPDLQGAVRDAKEIAAFLKIAGMKVNLVLNPTSRELKRALNALTYGVGREEDRAILFFFSGHGETEVLATGKKMGYIVPKDCPIPAKTPEGFTEKAISMNMIESYALRIKSKHVLMVFDSCFSGSVFASLKSVPTDISEKSNRPVRQFITAGNENEQVPDNSIFKTCFVQGIGGEADYSKDGYVTGSELGMYLDSSVVNYTRGAQHPQYGKIRHPKLDKGDFIFSLGKQVAPFQSSLTSSVETERQRLAAERANIERDRRELEQMKELMEERKRLEEERERLEIEKKKFDTAKLLPKQKHPPSVSAVSKDGEIARDGRFIAYDNGTVNDTKTNLMWAARDDGKGLMEHNVKDYIANYRGGGHTDWRLPTMEELEMIYDRDMENEHGYHVTKLVDISDEWVWGSEGWGNIWAFDFSQGSPADHDLNNIGHYGFSRNGARALPVRGGN